MSICARDSPPTCPPGQNYYVCQSTPYVGCCTHDPCQSGMCDANAGPGACVPVTLTVTETIIGTTTSLLPASGIVAGANDPGPSPSIGTATIAVGTTINTANNNNNNNPSIAQDTTVRITATANNTVFTTNTLFSSPNTLPNVSNAKSSISTSTASSTTTNSSHTPSTSTIAGSIIGGLAGLVLLALLLLCCCCHRKRIIAKLKRKGSDASELEEKAKELQMRESALVEAEKRKSMKPSELVDQGGFVIGKALGSPTGSGESGNGLGAGAGDGAVESGSGSGSGIRRRSQDAREQIGRWI